MAKVPIGKVQARLSLVLEMHNRTRNLVSPEPSTPEGHFVNENTVIRLAALMQDAGVGFTASPAQGAEEAEVCVRALCFLRDKILHAQGACPNAADPRDSTGSFDAYQEFISRHPAGRVAPGQPFCLDAQQVIQPIVDGCITYLKRINGRQGGRA